jgi:hydroxyacyl-ACP dehydratase HTD2-like protein with hotdog domain
MLQARIKEKLGPKFEILNFDYRNVAPLYAHEPLRLCGREVEGSEHEYKLWADGSDGRLAVRATATVQETKA